MILNEILTPPRYIYALLLEVKMLLNILTVFLAVLQFLALHLYLQVFGHYI